MNDSNDLANADDEGFANSEADREFRREVDKIEVGGENVVGTVFVIPLTAPLPAEISQVKLPTGSLYQRLVEYATGEYDGDYGFCPISGLELEALARSWQSLSGTKRAAALYGLPGARYDITFDHAVRVLGLRRVEWPEVVEAMSQRAMRRQRLADTRPWVERQSDQTARLVAGQPSQRGKSVGRDRRLISTPTSKPNSLPPPPDDDFEDSSIKVE